MKVLIAYDGSKCSEAALDDLTHAGLPEKGEVLVMSVAEVWLPPPPPSALEIVEMATTAKGALGRSGRESRRSETGIGPIRRIMASGLHLCRRDWLTNRFERFLLGSTAGAVAARAHCSVEVVRKRRRTPKRNGNQN